MCARQADPFRILLIDGDPRARESLPALIESWDRYSIVGVLPSADDLAQSAVCLRPDLVLLDIDIPGRSPLHAMEDLRYRALPARILVLSTLGDAPTVRACLAAGARGFILKPDAPRDLRPALATILAGDLFLSTRLSGLSL